MSLGTSNRDGGKTSESGHLRAIYKALVGEVLSGLNVSQRGAGANMSVDVAIGDAVIPRSDLTYGHPAFNDAIYNQAISAADVSNPRRDIIVMYIDYAQAPSTAVSNNTNGVVKIKVVNGTPAGSPSDPSDVAIQASVGSGNPFIKLARVAVAAGASSITNSVITDIRTLASGIQQAGGPLVVRNQEAAFDYVASGIVWSGDAYASTRAASMTAGVVYINGVRHTVAVVAARLFTASRDTYIDLLSNGDGTASPVYTEVTNNNTSPSLASNSVRVGIIITGASNIASVAAVNQGEVDKVLPIASTNPYAVTDSLGNLICPRDPNRKLLAYRQILVQTAINTAAATDIPGLTAIPFISPDSRRKIKVSAALPIVTTTAGLSKIRVAEGGTILQTWQNNMPTAGAIPAYPERMKEFSAGLHTIKGTAVLGGTTNSIYADGTEWVSWIKVELD